MCYTLQCQYFSVPSAVLLRKAKGCLRVISID